MGSDGETFKVKPSFKAVIDDGSCTKEGGMEAMSRVAKAVAERLQNRVLYMVGRIHNSHSSLRLGLRRVGLCRYRERARTRANMREQQSRRSTIKACTALSM